VQATRGFSRFYPDGPAVAHLLGYVGTANAKEYDAEDKNPLLIIPGFKIGKYHHRGEPADPDRMRRTFDREDEAVLREGVARYFPEANGPALAMKTCMFTNSPDEHFILDTHPQWPQVSIAAGFSGHGFKFATVVGEIMADFAMEGGCSRWDLGLFRLARFEGGASSS